MGRYAATDHVPNLRADRCVRQISAYVYLDNRIFREGLPIAQLILQSLEGSELMKAFMLDIPKPDSWRRDPTQIGGDFFTNIGSHLVDIMLWLGGAPARKVLASRTGRDSRARTRALIGYKPGAGGYPN
jgi:GFO/IDH/MocA C-terminal domain